MSDTEPIKVGKPPQHHVRINLLEFDDVNPPKDQRMVVVRYFLDRPGYGFHNSAARLWFHPPKICTPCDVQDFLQQQGIALEGLLVEVYLDKFESFMMLEACQVSLIEWGFEQTTYENPGRLNVRLTDLGQATREEIMTETQKSFPIMPVQSTQPTQPQHANTTPVGLFAFSMMVGLETIALMIHLVPNTVSESYVLTWGPYMFFVGGLLQVIVGILQVFRGNIYGATAFMVFGCLWFSNGLVQILRNHFSQETTIAEDLLGLADPWGLFLRSMYILAFSCALLKQTLVMNRLSTTLITLLCLKTACSSVGGWSETMQWMQLVFGFLTSIFAFYVFLVELTNQVYHREVFPTYKWSEDLSPEEVFGAAGRLGTLFSKAVRLRKASYPDVRRVREACEQGKNKEK